MTAPQHRNPMELAELQHLLRKTIASLEQLRDTIDTARSDAERGLMASLYTKLLMIKLQLDCDLERFK